MDRLEVIKNEVKSSLSQFGLNDVERDEYVSLVSEATKNLADDITDDDFTQKVKDNVSLLVPSAKLLQKTRTALQQSSANTNKELEDFKKMFEDYKAKHPEVKKEESGSGNDDFKKLFEDMKAELTSQITLLKEEQERERNERALKEKKALIIESVKKGYNKDGADFIDLLALRVDFSQDDAMDKLKTYAAEWAKSHPNQLFAASEDKPNLNKRLDEVFSGNNESKEEKERQEAFDNMLI